MSCPKKNDIKKINAIFNRLDKYWYADVQTKELKRKDRAWYTWPYDFIFNRKHTMCEFYWWLKQAHLSFMNMDRPLMSDNLPVKGVPMKYELLNGWSIPKEDLKHLYKGPLMSEGLDELLVPVSNRWQEFMILSGKAIALLLLGLGIYKAFFEFLYVLKEVKAFLY